MSPIERVGDLGPETLYLGGRQGSTGDPLGEGLALDQLHDQVVDPVLAPDIMQHADVRMIEPRNYARLALEPGARLRALGQVRGQHLDGYVAPQPRVPRAIDLAHPSRAKRSDDFIGAQTGADGQWHSNSLPQHCRCICGDVGRSRLWRALAQVDGSAVTGRTIRRAWSSWRGGSRSHYYHFTQARPLANYASQSTD